MARGASLPARTKPSYRYGYLRAVERLISSFYHWLLHRTGGQSPPPDSHRPADRNPRRSHPRLGVSLLWQRGSQPVAADPSAYQQLCGCYFNCDETDENVVSSLVPSPFTTVMIATEMPAAIRPYSMAVACYAAAANCLAALIVETTATSKRL